MADVTPVRPRSPPRLRRGYLLGSWKLVAPPGALIFQDPGTAPFDAGRRAGLIDSTWARWQCPGLADTARRAPWVDHVAKAATAAEV